MADFSLVPVDHDPFADDYQVQTPPQDLAKLYANNGGLGTIQDYVRRSGEALARIPSELGHNVYGLLEAAGTNVALPSLQRSQELYDTDWSKQPFIGIGQHGEFTGRLPALAEATVPYLAGGAPGGSLGAGMKLPGGYEGGYHGTPHTFAAEEGHPLGRFKDEAIGTGEGAQAYGYGHYVAGAKGVGENYMPAQGTVKVDELQYWGDDTKILAKKMEQEPGMYDAVIELENNGSINKAKESLQNHLTTLHPEDDRYANTQAGIDWLDKNEHRVKIDPGNLYHVEIKPQEHELLDWDKPLSEQSPQVQKVLQKIVQNHPDLKDEINFDTKLGEGIYRDLSYVNENSFPAASQAFHEAGIPGIKYLDAGSRQAQYDVFLGGKKIENQSLTVPIQEAMFWLKTARDQNVRQAIENAEQDVATMGHKKEPPDVQASREAGLEWLKQNKDNLTVEKQPQTYNYVIFHPDNLRVVGKNGEPIENYLKDTPVIKAYHGGPSNDALTKFSSDKFGSESGQSIDGLHVPGIYATSNPGVARWYRDIATDPYEVSWKGKVVQNPETDLPKEIRAHGLLPQGGIEGYIEKLQKNVSSPHSTPEWVRANQKELEFVQNNLDNLTTRKKSKDEMGSLFGVNLATEHNNLLDWEKPLSKQPSAVQQYIKKIDPDQKVFSNDMKGEYIYENLLHHHGVPKEATKLGDEAYTKYPNYAAPVTKILDENGIHGIKHLDKELSDQVGGPNGTTYVIFNPDKVSIHSKNNKPIENYLKDIK